MAKNAATFLVAAFCAVLSCSPDGGESKIQNRKSKISRRRPKLGQHFLHDQRYRARIIGGAAHRKR